MTDYAFCIMRLFVLCTLKLYISFAWPATTETDLEIQWLSDDEWYFFDFVTCIFCKLTVMLEIKWMKRSNWEGVGQGQIQCDLLQREIEEAIWKPERIWGNGQSENRAKAGIEGTRWWYRVGFDISIFDALVKSNGWRDQTGTAWVNGKFDVIFFEEYLKTRENLRKWPKWK